MKKSLIKLVAVSSAALALGGVVAPVVQAQELPDYVQSTEWNLEKIAKAIEEFNTRSGNRADLASDLKAKEATEAEKKTAYSDAVKTRQEAEAKLAGAKTDLAAAKDAAHNAAVELRDTLAAQKVDIDAIIAHYNEELEGERTTRKTAAANEKAALETEATNTAAEANRLMALIPADPGAVDDGTADYTERKLAYDTAVEAYNAAKAAADTAAAVNAEYDLEAVKDSIDTDVDEKVDAARDRVSNYYEHNGEYFEDLNGVLTQAIKRDADAKTVLTNAETAVSDATTELTNAQTAENTAAQEYKAAKEASRLAKVAYSSNESAIREVLLSLRAHADAEQIKNGITGGRFTDKQIEEFEAEYGKTSEQLQDEKDTFEKAKEDAETDLENIKDTTDVTDKEVLDPSKDDEKSNVVDPTESENTGDESSDGEETPDEETPGEDNNNGNGSNNGGSNSGSGQAELPETGESSSYAIFGAAALAVLAGVGLVAPSFKKEN
ncbi:LPXTG cell wall anchor domain-containing protein [Ruoffia sp. FAM 24228]|uniref:LPXTG cell wall anchor domain-containing protein n=1 Tax=Ruoffia sp. FAM 24228 TaxID=3259517 RepID=UPI0038848A21